MYPSLDLPYDSPKIETGNLLALAQIILKQGRLSGFPDSNSHIEASLVILAGQMGISGVDIGRALHSDRQLVIYEP